nr:histidine kinase dimerization/phosphoacceptor domain -containing protein [uncultured Arsenicibacter sp.]
MKLRCLPAVLLLFMTMAGAVNAQTMVIRHPESTYKRSTSAEAAVALAGMYRERGDWFRYIPQFNHDSTVIYYDRALRLLEQARPQPVAALAGMYAYLSVYYRRSAGYDRVRKLTDAGWKLCRQDAVSGENRIPALVQYDIRAAQAFAEIGANKPKAGLPLLLEAVALLARDTRPDVQARVQKDKGLFYARYQDKTFVRIDKDIVYLHQSRRFFETHFRPGYAVDLYDIYRSLIWSYNLLDKPDSCDYYFNKVYSLLPVLKMPEAAAWYYSYRGNSLNRRGRYDQGKPLIMRALSVCRRYRLTYTGTYPFSLNLMGVVLCEEGRFDQAMNYFLQARDAALANHTPNVQHDFLLHMINLHEAKGDYKKALDYSGQYADEAVRMAETYSINSLRENELKIELLEKENQLARQQAERQTYITVIVATALLTLLLAVAGFGLYRRNLHRQRTNRQLATLNTDLAKRNAENELLLKEIHHRVKNNLEVISSLLELQSAYIDDPDIQQAMLASQNRVQSMGILHQKLYQSEHLAFIEMKQYFQNLSENMLDAYDIAGRVTVECPMPELELDVDTAILVGLIVNELVSNALKYAFPEGQPGRVRLTLEAVGNDMLRLCVADNGIGKSRNATPKGTGFGTQLVELLTRQLEGTLQQEVNHGTSISVQFKRTRLI